MSEVVINVTEKLVTPAITEKEIVIASPGPAGASGDFRFENRTSDPASPAVGQVWIRTDLS